MFVAPAIQAHTPSVYAARLPDGAVVRVLAVGESKPDRFWGPSGESISNRSYFFRFAKLVNPLRGTGDPRGRWVVVALEKGRPSPSIVGRFADGPVHASVLSWDLGDHSRVSYLAVVEGNHRGNEVNLGIGVAEGPWKTIGTAARDANGKVAARGKPFLRMVRPWIESKAAVGHRDQVYVDVAEPTDIQSFAYRAIAIDRNGRAMPFVRTETPSDGLSQRYVFDGRYVAVARVELQTRQVAWVTFPHVRLAPR